MAEPKVGIKESLDVLEAMKVIGPKVIVALKDGAQMGDLVIALDPAVRAAAASAVDGAAQIPAELGDLDINEDVQLAEKAFEVAKAILAAVKAQA
jgi:hypothetical protein